MAKSRQDIQDDRQTGQDVALAVIKNDVGYIKDEVRNLNAKLDSSYVQISTVVAINDRLKLLEKAVYGFIGLVLVIVLGAVVGAQLK